MAGHPSIASSVFVDVDGTEQKLYGIWYPLFDTPVNIRMSREQMQALQDELRGRNVIPSWREHFADQLEAVLKASLTDG